jgi:AcrR family transcriptional regulator
MLMCIGVEMAALKRQKAAGTYQAHRERQRRRILAAASQLFDERGIDGVTMAEITSVSGVQPSTVYQYFSNKDDIVWEIVGGLMGERSDIAGAAMEHASNALARITILLEMMADDLSERPEKVRFMAQFDAIYARKWPVERLLALESQIHPEPFQFFRKLIRDGIADGSLKHDLDPDLTMHAVVNAVIGAQRRLASLGSKVETEYGRPIDQLLREGIRIILLGMRGETAQAGSVKPKSTSKSGSRKRSSS